MVILTLTHVLLIEPLALSQKMVSSLCTLMFILISVCDHTHIMLTLFILSLIEIFDQNSTTVALFN